MADFKAGDQVRLLSGGPVMTVAGISSSHLGPKNQTISCKWFAGKKLESGVFAPDMLEPVIEDESKKKVSPQLPELAKLMLTIFQRESYLDQAEAADLISDAGGDDHLYTNDNGNIGISPEVLKEFRKLTEETAIWMKSARAWRLRDLTTDTEDSREQPL